MSDESFDELERSFFIEEDAAPPTEADVWGRPGRFARLAEGAGVKWRAATFEVRGAAHRVGDLLGPMVSAFTLVLWANVERRARIGIISGATLLCLSGVLWAMSGGREAPQRRADAPTKALALAATPSAPAQTRAAAESPDAVSAADTPGRRSAAAPQVPRPARPHKAPPVRPMAAVGTRAPAVRPKATRAPGPPVGGSAAPGKALRPATGSGHAASIATKRRAPAPSAAAHSR